MTTKVFLDGEELEHWVVADGEKGYVIVIENEIQEDGTIKKVKKNKKGNVEIQVN